MYMRIKYIYTQTRLQFCIIIHLCNWELKLVFVYTIYIFIIYLLMHCSVQYSLLHIIKLSLFFTTPLFSPATLNKLKKNCVICYNWSILMRHHGLIIITCLICFNLLGLFDPCRIVFLSFYTYICHRFMFTIYYINISMIF